MRNAKLSTSPALASVVAALIVALVAGGASEGLAKDTNTITINADQIKIVSKQPAKPLGDQAKEALLLVDNVRATLETRAKNSGLVLLMDGKLLGESLSARAEYWFDDGLRLRAILDGEPLSADQSKCLVESVRTQRCFDGQEPPFIVRPIDPQLVIKAKASRKRCGSKNCRFVSIRTRLRDNVSLNPEQPIWLELDPRSGWLQTEIMMTDEHDLVSMTVTRKSRRIELVKRFVPDYSSSVSAP